MIVPFLDLKLSTNEIYSEVCSSIKRVIESGQYILGNEVEDFEKDFAAYCNAKYCLGVANGLDALRLVLHAWNIKEGDEVIVPSNTYIATWLAVSQCGAKPIPVEPDELTYNIDPKKIEKLINNKTKAIIAVHLYGQSADLHPIMNIAKKYNLKVMDDAAQAHGCKYKDNKIGSLTDATAWTFYPGKSLGALGDAGGITTNNEELATKIRALRNYGSNKKYINDLKGFNSRLDPIQAAVLKIKLKKLDEWNEKRKGFSNIYLNNIISENCILPYVANYSSHVWHLFVIRSKNRNELQKYLSANGIDTLIHYPIPPNKQLAYSDENYENQRIAEILANENLSLPLHPHLKISDLNLVINTLNKF